jgi:hypothetical protein
VLLASVPEEARRNCWWLVLRDGTPIAGDAGGGVAALGELRRTRQLATGLRLVRATGLIDALDKRIARNRVRLGRVVPDGPAPRRYP